MDTLPDRLKCVCLCQIKYALGLRFPTLSPNESPKYKSSSQDQSFVLGQIFFSPQVVADVLVLGFLSHFFFFLALPEIHCCMWAFSSCGKQGLLCNCSALAAY